MNRLEENETLSILNPATSPDEEALNEGDQLHQSPEEPNGSKPLFQRNSGVSSEGKHSQNDSNTSSLSSLSESQGFVIVDPSGKIFHGAKGQGQTESFSRVGLRRPNEPVMNLQYTESMNNLASIRAPSMTHEMQQRLEIEIEQFRFYMLLFQFFLVFQMCYDIYSNMKAIIYMDESLELLEKFYTEIDPKTLQTVFIVSIIGKSKKLSTNPLYFMLFCLNSWLFLAIPLDFLHSVLYSN